MSQPETRWTAETHALLASRSHEAECGGPLEDCVFLREHNEVAQDALEALADAGLLLPPGGEPREEWGARVWADGDGETERRAMDHARESRQSAGIVVAYHARQRAAVQQWTGNAALIHRTIYTGPWTEVPHD